MDDTMMLAIGVGIAVAAILGAIAYLAGKKVGDKKIAEAEKKAKGIVDNAYEKSNRIKKEKKQEIKEEWQKKKQEFNNTYKSKKEELRIKETAVQTREKGIDEKLDIILKKEKNLHNFEQDLKRKEKTLNEKEKKTDQMFDQMTQKLEQVSGMSREEARKQIYEELATSVRKRSAQKLNQIREDYKLKARKEAVNIVVGAIQRSASDIAIDNTVSVVQLESDDMKGRIIGREGRNIRAFEAATGIDLIIDDTPEAVIISGYDPFRREVAKRSLETLMLDGRIHPARIEEIVNKTEKELEEEIVEVGHKALLDLGLSNMKSGLVYYVGKMKYRSSYGQNLLNHSIEVANICGIMAAQLDLDVNTAKRAALLHDIGKCAPKEMEGPHAMVGMELAMKYKEKPVICNAIGAHHEDIEMETPIAVLVQAADSISGARPGARRESLENYIKRLEKLESIANQWDGVIKTYAIQAGRDLRVIVEPTIVNDTTADEMADEIANRIQEDMEYPGQIQVTVIREKRAVAMAK
jgi:ribonuclease Y